MSQRLTVSKGFDIGQILSSVDTAGCERHLDSCAGICGSFFHGSSTPQNDEVGQGDLLFFVGRVELVFNCL
jgi:hypothetical protein